MSTAAPFSGPTTCSLLLLWESYLVVLGTPWITPCGDLSQSFFYGRRGWDTLASSCCWLSAQGSLGGTVGDHAMLEMELVVGYAVSRVSLCQEGHFPSLSSRLWAGTMDRVALHVSESGFYPWYPTQSKPTRK